MNHPTVGRIPNGGLIERDSSLDLTKLQHLSLLLNEASFTTVEEVAAVINHELAAPAATVIDSRRVEIGIAGARATPTFPHFWPALKTLRSGCGARPRWWSTSAPARW